ncbi:alpha/beta-hydrolase [Cylindrobasidium torrendii FP15055 ss-10]|uniref:Alpha/beta-hydrolase n=1 Tax=Cylindrobasidium torrendii FP15055 ss-10 TaxID=1314674 RepID=A0A0D7BPI2_9AGAR|nr:alpha/beta-hydrolase [Cylindrobasidium torrendii FP15055 ss-10]
MTATTNIATIDAEGTQYAFTDTGVDTGGRKTLVIFHGTIFNGESFEPTGPSFREKGVRVINVQRRHYGRTSRHSEKDIADMASGNPDVLHVLARDVANFLCWLIDNAGPLAPGSLIVMSWSMGTSTVLALLGQPKAVPIEQLSKLEPYLSRIIIYDAPLTAFGLPTPPVEKWGLYDPFSDTSFNSVLEYGRNINLFLSAHFDHPDFASKKSSGLAGSRDIVNPTLAKLSEAEEARYSEYNALMNNADLGCIPYPPIQPMLKAQADCALFGVGESLVLPHVEVTIMGCEKSAWFLAWGYFESHRLYEEAKAQGRTLRSIDFVDLPGSNHFGHIEAPEAFVRSVIEAL